LSLLEDVLELVESFDPFRESRKRSTNNLHGMKLHGVTTTMPTHDGLEFKESGMMVVSVVYKHKAHGTTRVLSNFRPLEEKPYVLIVVCIDDEFTKSPTFSMD
jgi:hypothetical protein